MRSLLTLLRLNVYVKRNVRKERERKNEVKREVKRLKWKRERVFFFFYRKKKRNVGIKGEDARGAIEPREIGVTICRKALHVTLFTNY